MWTPSHKESLRLWDARVNQPHVFAPHYFDQEIKKAEKFDTKLQVNQSLVQFPDITLYLKREKWSWL